MWKQLIAKLRGRRHAAIPETADLESAPPQDLAVTPVFDQTPDQPQSFGYKISWFAIRTTDSTAVVDALEFGEAVSANWASGLAAVYARGAAPDSERWVFVSPPVDGWVLAIGGSFPYPTTEPQHDIGRKFDRLFSRLAKRFDDVQFFGSYRVVGFTTWARAIKGQPIRIFGFADGTVLENIGEQTPEEAKLGFADLTGLSPSDAGERIFDIAQEQEDEESRLVATGLSLKEAQAQLQETIHDSIPDESDVVELAGLWSIDPTQLEARDYPPGLGLAVRLPQDLWQ